MDSRQHDRLLYRLNDSFGVGEEGRKCVAVEDTGKESNRMRFRLSRHAERELQHRGISRQALDDVLSDPQQVVPAQGGKKV